MSGITSHMIFEKKYIKELINLIENNNSCKFYEIFLSNVIQSEYNAAGASEYEIYFNFMLKYHSDKIIIRKLNWGNHGKIEKYMYDTYDYVSIHWYIRRN